MLAQPAEPGTPIPTRTLPESPILLSDNEVIWRQYRVVQLLTRRKGEGTLYVTDSRVVFYARAKGRGTQRPSLLMQQTKLEDITGLAVFVSRRVSLWLFIGALFAAGLALASYQADSVLATIFFLALAVACVAGILVGKTKHGAVGVSIDSKDARTIAFGRFGVRRGPVGLLEALTAPLRAIFGVPTADDVPYGRPAEHAEKLVAELGALIMDLQTRGSMAGEHWGVEVGQSQVPGTARSV